MPIRGKASNDRDERVWAFDGANGIVPGGTFTDIDRTGRWIEPHGLIRTLTSYPLNKGVYEWGIGKRFVQRRNSHESSPCRESSPIGLKRMPNC